MSQEPPFDPPNVALPAELALILELGRAGDGGDGGQVDSGELEGLTDLASLDDVRRFIERTADTLPGNVGASAIELEKMPRRLWEQTLASLHPQERMWAAQRVPDGPLSDLAFRLASALNMAEHGRRDERAAARGRARRSGAPLPTPTGDHATRRSSIQVNMRLRADDHERLKQAAEAVGCKPTTLARSLVLNGVAMILRDHALQR